MTTPVSTYAAPHPQDRGPRPATAAVAAWLQGAVALLAASLIPFAWYMHARWTGLIDEAVRSTPGVDLDVVAAERSSSLFGAIVFTVVAGLTVLWFGGTLAPLWRGSNVARVMSLVGSGMVGLGGALTTCCGMLSGLLFLPLLISMPMEPDPAGEPVSPLPEDAYFADDPFTARLYELSDRELPWSELVFALGIPLAVLSLVAIFVLLLVPPSNRWYSPRQAQPPFPAHPYPVYAHPAYQYPAPPYSAPPARPAPPAGSEQPPAPL
ncbi:hypothetical protein [Catellatospora sp. NPDC049609]|uniref:hypothetical protein n=1 Tax=Catellatospora sp. NPDC049609 TaxID=3155505 RepID=UPI00341D8985